MSGTVDMDVPALKELAAIASSSGKSVLFSGVALQWIEQADAHIREQAAKIERLKAELSGWREHEDEIKAKMQRFDGLQAETLQLREAFGSAITEALPIFQEATIIGLSDYESTELQSKAKDILLKALTATPRTEALAEFLASSTKLAAFYIDVWGDKAEDMIGAPNKGGHDFLATYRKLQEVK